MNGFPVLFGVFAVFLALWKSSFSPGKSLRLYRTETWLCYGVTAACAGGVCRVLLGWSASDVREDSGELAFYLVFSLAAIAAAQTLFAFLGVSLRRSSPRQGRSLALRSGPKNSGAAMKARGAASAAL